MMMLTNTKYLKIFFVLLLLQISFVHAEQKPVAQLKNFLATTKNLTANFKQIVFDESGKEKQTSYGIFNLSRPGKFRWNYQKPFLQEIVSNSGKVWFYDADLEQVTIKKLDRSMGSTPALLLTGDVEIEKEFNIESQGSEEGMQWIKLVPKNAESNFKYVLIGLNDGSLGGMELNDNFGQLTRIYFSDVNTSPQFKADEFVFNIPKGVDVLEDKDQDKQQAKERTKENSKVATEIVDVKPQNENDEEEPAPTRHHVVRNHAVNQLVNHSSDKNSDKNHDKSKDKDQDKHKDKEKDKDKSHDKHKDKDSDKHSDKEKSHDKHSDKEKSHHDKHKEKDSDKEKSDKHKDKDKEKSHDKHKDKDKDKEKSHDKEKHKSHDKHKDKDKHK